MSKWRARALELFPEMRSEVESAKSVGALWIELIMRVHCQFSAETDAATQDSKNLFRAICLYATWCRAADSPKTQEAAAIEFYFDLPSNALRCPAPVYKRIIHELVANLPLREVEEMGGGSLQPDELKRFLRDVEQADDERRRRSQKRSG